MTVTGMPSRRRTITRVVGAAAAWSAVTVLTGCLLSAGGGAGEGATVSADVHLAAESTTALDEPTLAAKRRSTKSNTSDYLKVILKEAG